MSEHRHETHPAIVKRLNRAGGHLRSIVEMIENERLSRGSGNAEERGVTGEFP